jgi:hypothetical protein
MRTYLSYANVMATVAVFLALGGGAYAAIHPKKNSIGARQLRNNAVRTSKLADNAVTPAKLADGSVGSAKIAAGSVGIADVSTSLHLLCRSGTTFLQDACIQNTAEGDAGFSAAEADCKNLGGRLPNPGELLTLGVRGGLDGNTAELTNAVSFNVNPPTFVVQTFTGSGGVGSVALSNGAEYRCVFDPTG